MGGRGRAAHDSLGDLQPAARARGELGVDGCLEPQGPAARDGAERWLAETTLRWPGRHTVFARLEREDESELFAEGSPLHDQIIRVNKLSAGYQYELPVTRDLRLALGGLASAYAYPARLEPTYGKDGAKIFMLYLRASYGNRNIG